MNFFSIFVIAKYITHCSYGFSINGWVNEHRPELLKIKGLRIYQFCLEQDADEVYETK
jgi:hypothetical protein